PTPNSRRRAAQMHTTRRDDTQPHSQDSPFPIVAGVGTLTIAVSCMFLTVGFTSDLTGLLYAPILASLLFFVGGYYEKHAVAKAVNWSLAWIITAAAGLIGIIGSVGSENGSGPAVLVCLGLLLIPTGLVAYSIWQGALSYRQAIAESLDQMLLDLIQIRHDVSFEEAVEELKISKIDVLHRAEGLVDNGRFHGTVDPTNERLYSLTGLAQKQSQMASIVQAKGQLQLQDLSQEMKVPEALLKEWLYQQGRLGHFSGYVDWENGVVYSRQREDLLKEKNCPNCAAELNVLGQGIIGCQYCQAEIFV
ncbi:MAG: hypothetical protein AAF490_33110, partial [Chloroflexota bacterium]